MVAQKTWKDLLGDSTKHCFVQGNDIVRGMGDGRMHRLWSFDTKGQAFDALAAWVNELHGDVAARTDCPQCGEEIVNCNCTSY